MSKTKTKQSTVAPEKEDSKPEKSNMLAPEKLVLLVTVVNRNKSDYFLDLIQSFNCNMQMSSFAHGTAQRALGLLTPDAEKDVLFSILTRDNAKQAMEALEEKFATIRGGKGVSFTVPITSTIGVLIYRFLANKQ